MPKFYMQLIAWAILWCVVGVAASVIATALGVADSSTVKAAIVAWVLFIGTGLSGNRLYVREKNAIDGKGKKK
ncbi:hypothetical protein [Streptomyces sp. NPDC051569]|uniref:hypothetical protein n=1 Tax=Streptomyces sp. NPDC051569 TaxID=3365661 RepID=UPI00378D6B51